MKQSKKVERQHSAQSIGRGARLQIDLIDSKITFPCMNFHGSVKIKKLQLNPNFFYWLTHTNRRTLLLGIWAHISHFIALPFNFKVKALDQALEHISCWVYCCINDNPEIKNLSKAFCLKPRLYVVLDVRGDWNGECIERIEWHLFTRKFQFTSQNEMKIKTEIEMGMATEYDGVCCECKGMMRGKSLRRNDGIIALLAILTSFCKNNSYTHTAFAHKATGLKLKWAFSLSRCSSSTEWARTHINYDYLHWLPVHWLSVKHNYNKSASK